MTGRDFVFLMSGLFAGCFVGMFLLAMLAGAAKADHDSELAYRRRRELSPEVHDGMTIDELQAVVDRLQE